MNSYEIKTYPEYDKFCKENERVGFHSSDFSDYDIENIWICEIYKNKETGKYSLLITRDSDEARIVFDFE